MIIEISVAVAVFVFAVLAFFIIRTLITARHTLQRVDYLLFETEMRLKNVDPLLRSISNLGDVCEEKTCSWKRKCNNSENGEYRCEEHASGKEGLVEGIIDWLILGLTLGNKIYKRR